jgi:O-antigen/teichoic acid export membrane protein
MNIRSVVGGFGRLFTGEIFGRLATFALFAFVSRRYGVELLGILALAQTMAMYVMEGSDQGYKLVGARMVARQPELAAAVVPIVLRRRTLLALLCIALAAAYAMLGPVPANARLCVLAFAFAVLPYALSLDWMAWGLGHFGTLAVWRSGSGILYVALAIAGMLLAMNPVAALSAANFSAATAGAVLLWLVWRMRWRPKAGQLSTAAKEAAQQELRPGRVFTLGLSNLLNLVFLNADVLLLAALSTVSEVGRYSAATKPLYVIFTGFWLLTDALYPQLAKMEPGPRARTSMLLWLLGVAAASSAAALLLAWLAPWFLTLLYGSTLGAAGLFRILLIALPLDFCFSVLWTVLVSRGFERVVLCSTAAAAIANVALNLAFIPRFQAEAAAWITVASYALLFLSLLVYALRKNVLAQRVVEDPEAANVLPA